MSQNVSSGCPQCLRALGGAGNRLVTDACGHRKCRECLLSEEDGCFSCKRAAGESSVVARSVGAGHRQTSEPPAGAARGHHGSTEGVPPAPDGDVTLVRTRRQCSDDVGGTRAGRRSRPGPRRRTPDAADGEAGAASVVSTSSTRGSRPVSQERHRHVPRDNTGKTSVAAMSSQIRQTERTPVETEAKPLWMSLHRHSRLPAASVVSHTSVISVSSPTVVVLATAAPETAHCVSSQGWSNTGAGPSRCDGNAASLGAECSVVGAAAGSQSVPGRSTVRLALPRVVLLPQQPAHRPEHYTPLGNSRRGPGPPLMIPLSLVRAAGNDTSAGRQQSNHSLMASAESLPQSCAPGRDPSPAESSLPQRRREVLVREAVSVSHQDRHSTRDTTVSGVAGVWRQSAGIAQSSPDVLGREDRRAAAEEAESTRRPSSAASVAGSNTERVTWAHPATTKGPVVSAEHAERVTWASPAATKGPVVSAEHAERVTWAHPATTNGPVVSAEHAERVTWASPAATKGIVVSTEHAERVTWPSSAPIRGSVVPTVFRRDKVNPGEVGYSRPPAGIPLAVASSCTYTRPSVSFGTSPTAAHSGVVPVNTPAAHPQRRNKRECVGEDNGLAVKRTSAEQDPATGDARAATVYTAPAGERYPTPHAPPGKRLKYSPRRQLGSSLPLEDADPDDPGVARKPSSSAGFPGPVSQLSSAPRPGHVPETLSSQREYVLAVSAASQSRQHGSGSSAVVAAEGQSRSAAEPAPGVSEGVPAVSPPPHLPRTKKARILAQLHREGTAGSAAAALRVSGDSGRTRDSSKDGVRSVGCGPATQCGEAEVGSAVQQRREHADTSAASAAQLGGMSNFFAISKNEEGSKNASCLSRMPEVTEQIGASAEEHVSVSSKHRPDVRAGVRNERILETAAETKRSSVGKPAQDTCDNAAVDASVKQAVGVVESETEVSRKTLSTEVDLCNDAAKVATKEGGHPSKKDRSSRSGKSSKKITAAMVAKKVEKEEGSKPEYQCLVCHKRFGTFSHWKYHISCRIGKFRFRCKLCSWKGNTRQHFNYHMARHKGTPASHCCTVCPAKFLQKSTLDRHMATHSQGSGLECSVCAAKFTCPYNHQRHMRTHTGERPFACKVCQRAFSDQGNLKKHEKSHAGGAERQCPVCPARRVFRSAATLTQHLRECHGLPQPGQRHACLTCNKQFSRRSDLHRHQRIHSEEKEFCCPMCRVTSRRLDTLSRHMAAAHGLSREEARAQARRAIASGEQRGPPPQPSPQAEPEQPAAAAEKDGVSGSCDDRATANETAGMLEAGASSQSSGVVAEAAASSGGAVQSSGEGVAQSASEADELFRTGGADAGWGADELGGILRENDPSKPLVLDGTTEDVGVSELHVQATSGRLEGRAAAQHVSRQSPVTGLPPAGEPRSLSALLPAGDPTPRLTAFRAVVPGQHRRPLADAAGWRRHSVLVHRPAGPEPPRLAELRPVRLQPAAGPPPSATQLIHQHTGESTQLIHQHTGESTQLIHQHTGESAHVMDQHTSESTHLMHHHTGESAQLIHQHTSESAHVMHQHTSESAQRMHHLTDESTHVVHHHTDESAHVMHQHTSESTHVMHQDTGESTHVMHQRVGESTHLMHHHTGESTHVMRHHTDESTHVMHQHTSESAHLMHQDTGESTHVMHQPTGESTHLMHHRMGEFAHLVHQHTGESARRMHQHTDESAHVVHHHTDKSTHVMHHHGGESTHLHQHTGGPLAEQVAMHHVPEGAPLYEVRCYGDAAYGQEDAFIQDLSGEVSSEREQRDGGSLPQQQRHRHAAPLPVSDATVHGLAADVPPGWVMVPTQSPSEPPWPAEQPGYPPAAAAAAAAAPLPVHSAGTPPAARCSPHSVPSPDRAAQLTSSQNHLRQLIGGTAFDGLSAMFDNLRNNVVACMAARGRGGRPPL